MSTVKTSAGPTFQHFLLQSQLLQAYRAAIRITRPLPDAQTRRETLDYLREDLERLRLTSDIAELKNGLSTFQRSIKTLGPSLGLSGLTESQGARLIGRPKKKAVPW